MLITIISQLEASMMSGHSQEFQKGISINGRINIKQGSVGVQFQMLMSRAHEFNTFIPNNNCT